MPYPLQHEKTLLCAGAQMEGDAFSQTTWFRVPLLTLWIALLGRKLPVKWQLLLKAKRRCWILLVSLVSVLYVSNKCWNTVLGIGTLSLKEQKHGATHLSAHILNYSSCSNSVSCLLLEFLHWVHWIEHNAISTFACEHRYCFYSFSTYNT